MSVESISDYYLAGPEMRNTINEVWGGKGTLPKVLIVKVIDDAHEFFPLHLKVNYFLIFL